MPLQNSMSRSEMQFFIRHFREQIDALKNGFENFVHLLGIEDEEAVVPVKSNEKLIGCIEKTKKFIEKIAKRERGLDLMYVREFWMTRDNITGKLATVDHEYDNRVSIGSYTRTQDRRKVTDPDEIVRAEIDKFVLKTFKWFVYDGKQHRIDIHYPYRNAVSITVV